MAAEMLQELDFPQSSFCKDLFAENIRDFLDCDSFIGLVVGSGTGSRFLANSGKGASSFEM